MYTKLKFNKLFLLLFFISFSISSYSQVGINTENPDPKAILDVVSLDKGVLLPRMTKVERDNINPNTTSEQGLLIYNSDEDCYNYWNKTDLAWVSLCGEGEKAEFTINCDSTVVYGTYKNGIPVTANEYITVKVTVTQEGPYDIKAISNTDNGYFFQKKGEFLVKGSYIVQVPAYGTPINFTTPSSDNFSIIINEKSSVSDCTFSNEVTDASIYTIYSIDPKTIVAEGVYMQNVVLDATNQIKLDLIVQGTATGKYRVYTNEVAGISFSGSGTLSSNPQSITLKGIGTPETSDPIVLQLKTDSPGRSPIIFVTITPVLPAKRILALGSFGIDGTSIGDDLAAVNTMLTRRTNFGSDLGSVVKTEPIVNNGVLQSPTAGAGIVRYATIDDNLLIGLLTRGTDYAEIVVVGYDWFPTASQAEILIEYARQGGVVLFFCEEVAPVQYFMNNLFGTGVVASATSTYNEEGSVYKFADINDPILNGPFGNVSGTYWGKARYSGEFITRSAVYVTNIPVEDVIVYSNNFNYNNLDPAQQQIPYAATVFRHKTLPILFIGDGFFTSGSEFPPSDNYSASAFKIGVKKIGTVDYPAYPLPRTSFGKDDNTYRTSVYNSVFFANAMAWALQMAEKAR